ncbi:hypothetical protein TanjilG_22357 [Lupinus angustifolius]|uniref:DRBM domain-containing protein n=1 Tax=Lupinus angustifolius TaxID=3871 RepID=A0A1J7GZT3_LUPAN|nr:hypothetical protein TanjilG_22357 [Lupinus angustifolius]
MYKTKLQELCHDRKLGLPKYYTKKDGPDHMPTFKATVYVNSVTCTSLATFTSSKQAQNQAAMLAFNTFSSPPHGSSTPTAECDTKQHIETEKPLNVPSDSSVILNVINTQLIHPDTGRPCKSQLQNYAQWSNPDPSISSSKTEAEQAAAEVPFMSLSVDISEKAMDSKEFHGKAAKSKKEAQQNAAKVAYLALKEYELKEVKLEDISSVNIKLSSNEQYYNVSKRRSSYLLCNRFKMYTCFPNIAAAFSEGITVMPIADNKWVAMSLEFPNEGL